VVIVLAIEPKVRGFNTAEDNGFIRAIKVCSTTSFGGKVNSSVPCSKILQHVKFPCEV
jgi:hypothetical protein